MTYSPRSAGTSKSTNYSTMYMGHVPMNPKNREIMFDNRSDTTRAHIKDNMRFTVERNLPGYMGHRPRSVHNDTQDYRATDRTTSGNTYKNHELVLNDGDKPHVKRKWMLSNFFSAPTGEGAMNAADGITDAEKFYKNFRPKEALPKLGMKSERSWVNEIDLKRSYIFQSNY